MLHLYGNVMIYFTGEGVLRNKSRTEISIRDHTLVTYLFNLNSEMRKIIQTLFPKSK